MARPPARRQPARRPVDAAMFDAVPFGARRLDAVLFDYHGTLAEVEHADRSVALAAAACGVSLSGERLAEVAAAMEGAGLAAGWPPRSIPPEIAGAWANRDLSAADHRAAFVGIVSSVDAGIPGLAEAMYERKLTPDGWMPYPDTVPVLRALRERGVRTAVVSNIGFDIRPIGTAHGYADLIDAWVLSYEVGVCKPEPAIFRHACDALGVDPVRALMVGDTTADAGAAAISCPSLILPASPPGQLHGLGAVLALVCAGAGPPV